MPTDKTCRVICFIIALSTNTMCPNPGKVVPKKLAALSSSTTLSSIKDLSPAEFMRALKQARIKLLSACANCKNYELISDHTNQLLELVTQQQQASSLNYDDRIIEVEAKAKFFQLISTIAENHSEKMLFLIGNLYRYVGLVFEWQTSDWKSFLAKYQHERFRNYVKYTIVGIFFKTVDFIGAFLTCVKIVDFIQKPSKTINVKDQQPESSLCPNPCDPRTQGQSKTL